MDRVRSLLARCHLVMGVEKEKVAAPIANCDDEELELGRLDVRVRH